MFILYIDNLHSLVQSLSLKIYADDVALYARVSSRQNCIDLQGDLSRIHDWSLRWQLNLSPSKCEALNITNKRSPIPFTYHIGSVSVTWCNKVKYLGVVITSNLKWNDHCQCIVHKATQLVPEWAAEGYMHGCTDRAKALAYMALVWPCLEYYNVVCTLHTSKNLDLIESVQHRAARWIKSSFDSTIFRWTKSSSECLELRWPSLEMKRNYMCVVISVVLVMPFTFSFSFSFSNDF